MAWCTHFSNISVRAILFKAAYLGSILH
jgi:hypothetical protein